MTKVYCHNLIDYLRHCLASGQPESDILREMTTQEVQDLDLAIDELQSYVHSEIAKRQITDRHR